MRSDFIKLGAMALFSLICIGVGIWWSVSIWSECRAEHSWMYCVKLISR